MSNPEPVAHHVGPRPMVGHAYEAARLTRAEIHDAIRGHFAETNPNTPGIIDRICLCHSRLDAMDKRRIDGRLFGADVEDYAANVTAAATYMRQIGLYPATWSAPSHV